MATEPYVKQTWDTTSYVNPTRMNHIEDGIEDASISAIENADKVAENDWNLLRQPYYHGEGTSSGITRTINTDGSVTMSGTASATFAFNFKRYSQSWKLAKGTYIYTGCPSGGSDTTYFQRIGTSDGTSSITWIGYDTGEGFRFTLTQETIMQVNAGIYNGYAIVGSLTFAPKIVQVSADLSCEDNGVLGAKNLNSYPYYTTSSSGASGSGVTWTVNSDGTIKVTGKATSSSTFYCHNRTHPSKNELFIPNGRYILSGCPSGGSSTRYRLTISSTVSGENYSYGDDLGDGLDLTINGDDYSDEGSYVRIATVVSNNYDCGEDGIVFKPMLRRYGDTDDTWQPYAMSNKKITDIIGNAPTTAGTYTLQCVVDSNGIPTFSWV